MRESIILAVGFAIAVAVGIAVSPYPIATAVGLASGGVLAVAIATWRPVKIAIFTLIGLFLLATVVVIGIHEPTDALLLIGIVTAFLAATAAVSVCLAYVFNKISETNDPRFQIVFPIILSGMWALCAWLGSSSVFLGIFGVLILVGFCLEVRRLLKWKRAA